MKTQIDLNESEFHIRIRDAWNQGRTIVPIIGAGASADSGFPALASIVRYIAKLTCYLRHSYFLPSSSTDVPFADTVEEFSQRIDKYVSVFGWPDRFQLNADLRGRLQQTNRWPKEWDEVRKARNQFIAKGLMGFAICEELDELASKINPGGAWGLNKYLDSVDIAKNQMAIAKKTIKSLQKRVARLPLEWQKRVPDLSKILKESHAHLTPSNLDLPSDTVNSFRYQVVGDWKPLLRHVSCYQPELVDGLFSSLARHRKPGTGHVLLAHLSQLLRIRTLFTFNFDPFIETALARENISHRVFAMEHGSELPTRHHLHDDAVAVIKMHGSTHNILVDERVDYRVSERYRRQFRDLVGKSPVFLVMGCSGNDRRLVDLIGEVLADEALSDPRAIWIHHKQGDKGPEVLSANNAERFSRFGTYDLGQALQRLFESLTDRLPTSTAPYVAHITRPVITAKADGNSNSNKQPPSVHTRAVTVFVPNDSRSGTIPITSRDFMHALAEVPLGYSRISVDLEEHHSLEQLVAEIIDQIRRGDSSIPPFVTSGGIPLQGSDARSCAKRAAERVLFALRRSRYVLSISGIDAFPFRATTHHGITRLPPPGQKDEGKERFQLLLEFLKNLAESPDLGGSRKPKKQSRWSLGDSVLVLHYERPYARHADSTHENASVKKVTTLLNNRMKALPGLRQIDTSTLRKVIAKNSSADVFYLPPEFGHDQKLKHPELDDFDWRIATAAIVSLRRTRTRVGFTQLIRELFAPDKRATLINFMNTRNLLPRWMCWTEEGGLWCDRPARDWVYDYNTRWTATERQKKDLDRSRALAQAFQASVIHDRIARNYYLNQFLPSRDAFLFLEYVYHRVSTLRYLFQIQVILTRPNASLIVTEANNVYTEINEKGAKIGLFFRRLSEYSRASSSGSAPDNLESTKTDWDALFSSICDSDRADISLISGPLRELRVRCFRGLHQTWRRTESYLRHVLPPDQTIAWCRNLLEYNLDAQTSIDERKDRLVLHNLADEILKLLYSKNDLRIKAVKENLRSLLVQEKSVREERDSLVEAIKSTKYRAMYTHATYGDIVDDKWLCGPDSEIDPKKSPTSEEVHWQLNRKVAQLWHLQSSGDGANGTLSKIDSDIGKIAKRTERDNRGEFAEPRLRLHYLKAEVVFSRYADLSPPMDEKTFDKLITPLRNTQSDLDNAIEEAREEYPHTSRIMQNPMLEPTADRGLFIPYKSLFQIQLGRCRLLEAKLCSLTARAAVTNSDRFPKWATKESKLLERAKELLTDAYRDLAYAKNGIGQENAVLLAIADLCSADVAIEGSELAWGKDFLENWELSGETSQKSEAKLQTASGYLSKCWSRLLEGPRYVLIWRFFHLSQTQYHIRRISAIIDAMTVKGVGSNIIDEDHLTKRTGELVRRTKLCLTGIRFGLDYSPPHSASAFRRKFIGLWRQLCAVALSAGGILARSGNAAAVSLLDLLIASLVDLNLSQDMFSEETEALGVNILQERFRAGTLEPLSKVCKKWEKIGSIRQLVELHDYIREDFADQIAKLCASTVPSKEIALR